MKTKVIKIKDKTRPEDGELLEAAEILRSGGLVAFPCLLYTSDAADE